MFGGFFLYSGIQHFVERRKLAQYAAAKKIPAPELAVTASGAALVLGGTSIVLRVKPKLGAAAIACFLAGVSPSMHDFWKSEDPNQRTNDMIHFSKNIALLGAALALVAVEEPWPVSVPVAQANRPKPWRKVRGRRIAA